MSVEWTKAVDWTAALSAFASVVSALVAFVGWFFAGSQLRSSRKTADFQALFTLMNDIRERQRALFDAREDPEVQEVAFFELVNSLECHSAAYLGELFDSVSGNIALDTIAGSLAVIEDHPVWGRRYRSAAALNSATFSHLNLFALRFRSLVESKKNDLRRQAAGIAA